MNEQHPRLTGRPSGEADWQEEDESLSVLDDVSDLIQHVAPDGSLRHVNRAWREALGYVAADLPRLNLQDIIHSASRPQSRYMFQRLPDGARQTHVEAMLIAKDGRAVAVEGQSRGVFRDGRHVSTRSILRDVTKRQRAEAALVESVEKYGRLVESLPDVVWSSDQNGELVFISPNIEKIFGYTPREMYAPGGALWFGRMHSEDVKHARAAYEALFERGAKFDVEYRIRRKDGEWIWLHDRAVATYEEHGKTYTTGLSTDITERKRIEAELLANTTLQRVILESANYSIISTDRDGVIRTFNTAAERWLGYTAAEVIGRHTSALFHDPDEVVRRAGELTEELGRPIQPGLEIFKAKAELRQLDEREWTYVRKDGTRFPARVSITPLRDAVGEITGYLGIASDITELKRAEEALRDLSLTDDLTGLRNRRGFIALAEQQLKFARAPRRAQPLLLLYADMDGLKQINDRFGHHVGSQALIETGRIIRQVCRETDIVARIGGDEFAVLVVDAAAHSADSLFDRLQQKVRDFNAQGGQPYTLGVSLGTARIEADSTATIEELLARADEAMYEHKRRKKNHDD
ncbi:MAG: PAS domain S-box protein [Acidobacteriota bacterium]|nr:PAS domain S-box protein [Acidobacteriota bacterium]